jgi:hypothetical protein
MAESYGPKIVRDGLILNLDAADINSYPGSGTIWRDVSGNNNSGSLINGPTFDTANGGSIVFDGTNDYVDYNSTVVNLNSSFTFASWVQTPSNLSNNSSFRRLMGRGDNNSAFTGEWAATSYNSLGNGFAFEIDDDVTKSGPFGNIIITPNTWYYVIGVANRTNALSLYINGILDNSTADNTSLNINPPYNLYIGSQRSSNTPSFFLNGKIALNQVYNKALTPQEIAQNYNATKTRFGL